MKTRKGSHCSNRLRLRSLARQSFCLLGFSLSILLLTSQVNIADIPEGAYFGQESPGSTPQAFGKGILPDDLHSIPVFTADGRAVYFKPMEGDGILVMRMLNGKWSLPGPLFVREEINNSDDPCLSSDGNTLFFSAYSKKENREFIYYCRQENDFACIPALPAGELNTLDLHWQFSVTGNGNVYFSSNGNIYCSCVGKDGKYLQPIRLDTTINTQQSECTPYVTPDESTMIFSRGNGTGSDLYISHKDKKGAWQTARPLPSGINTEFFEMCPGLSADGRFLFFLSSRGGLFSAYWVETDEWLQ